MDYATFFHRLDELLAGKRMDEAEQFLIDNMKAAMDGGDTQGLLTVMSELIGLYRVTGRAEESMLFADKSMMIARNAGMEGTEGYATIVLNSATAYRAAGRMEKAEELYAETIRQLKLSDCKDAYHYASLYNNISLLYQETGRDAKAQEELNKALELIRSLPNCEVEEATTYVNLALLYIKQDKYEQAEENIKRALTIFEKDRGNQYKDSHYGAALSAYGDLEFKRGNYKEAVSLYEEALAELARSYGYYNDSYRITCTNCIEACRKAVQNAGNAEENTLYAKKLTGHEEKLEEIKQGDRRISGMELAKRYYETYVKDMLHRHFAEYEDRIAVGLCGHGSECYGFDDALSEDHDYGPSVCLWLTDEDYKIIGDSLASQYAALPKSFMGVPERTVTAHGQNRVGVLRISDFYKEHIGRADAPDRTDIEGWNNMPSSGIAAAVNGEVFCDNLGEFTGVRRALLSYYPDKLWYVKMAEAAARMAQYGQYNYHRCIIRGDYVAALAAFEGFIKETMNIAFLIYREYMPYYKWSYRALRRMGERRQESLLTRLADKLGQLAELDYHKEEPVQDAIEDICRHIVKILQIQGLSGESDCYMEKQSDAILAGMKPEAYSDTTDAHSDGISSSYNKEDDACNNEDEDRTRKNALVEAIVEAEWNMFQATENEGGRADCQNNWNTFRFMRTSQFDAWEENLLSSYLEDLRQGEQTKRNLIAEKYGRMMESTAPEKYAEIEKNFPAISPERKAIAEQVIAIQVSWLEQFCEQYPKLSMQIRHIHTSEDTSYDTSAETYLRGELDTYSEDTFILYCRYVIRLYKEGRNLNKMIMENTVHRYGYRSLEDAESRLL